jgi:hypothetical protein
MENLIEFIKNELEDYIDIAKYDYLKGDLTLHFIYKEKAFSNYANTVTESLFGAPTIQTNTKFLTATALTAFSLIGADTLDNLYDKTFTIKVKPNNRPVHFNRIGAL